MKKTNNSTFDINAILNDPEVIAAMDADAEAWVNSVQEEVNSLPDYPVKTENG